MMSISRSWTVEWQDTGDGTGDIVVDLNRP